MKKLTRDEWLFLVFFGALTFAVSAVLPLCYLISPKAAIESHNNLFGQSAEDFDGFQWIASNGPFLLIVFTVLNETFHWLAWSTVGVLGVITFGCCMYNTHKVS